MAGFQPPPRVKNALDNRKLNLSTPTPGAQGKYASLIWGLIANNPRITVYTNDPNDQGESKGYGKITANLDLPVLFMFLEQLKQVIEHDGEIKYKIENKNFIFPGGKRSEKPVITSELWFGKDKEGMVWISVVARDRPKIKFTLAPSDFHHLMNADGTAVSAGQVSKLYGRAYTRILEQMFINVAADNYVEPPKKEGGNTGGGYSKQGGRSGGNNSNSNDNVEDDMPF